MLNDTLLHAENNNWYPGKYRKMLKSEESNDYQKYFYNGRQYLFYKPEQVGVPLLIILHGGLGNPNFISRILNLRETAENNKFAVAYLSGTPVKFRSPKLTWNAGGGCCGEAARSNIDDASYIDSFIKEMVKAQGIDSRKVFIGGHSNGSMMAYRFMCEKGNVAGVIAISGPLMLDKCPHAKGVNVLHIHGQLDNSVPIVGGYGSDSLAKVYWNSLSNTQQTLKSAGANFSVDIIPGAGHKLTSILESVNLPETITQFIFSKTKNR